MNWLIDTWYGILLICFCAFVSFVILSIVFYKSFFKRFFDIVFSFLFLIVLSPLLICLTIFGTFFMKGNPFFIQQRPGKDGIIFSMVKFRSMNNRKDSDGKYLPDKERLSKYGVFLRKTSFDELPEFLNILCGKMSFVGPRPLLVKYLPLYNQFQNRRHEVRPGLTGYAQVNGRNHLSWEEKFNLDVWYVDHLSFFLDVKIILKTFICVFSRNGINQAGKATTDEFTGNGETK
jgi:lipopolysaccharide/colanic/teichoic acid biosynthesis glycosyltransferase